jgi:hypothetical protein
LAKQANLAEHILNTLRNSVQGTTEFGQTYWMGFRDREAALDDILTHNLEFSRTHATISEKNMYANYGLIYEMLKNKFSEPHRLQTFISYQ